MGKKEDKRFFKKSTEISSESYHIYALHYCTFKLIIKKKSMLRPSEKFLRIKYIFHGFSLDRDLLVLNIIKLVN